MKKVAPWIFALLLVAPSAIADQPPAATAPANPLLGRWKVLSMGKKKLPVPLFWTFDERNVVVTTGNGDVATKSQYSLRKDGEHDVISLCEDGKSDPSRVGWYERECSRRVAWERCSGCCTSPPVICGP
jgi:hypothetical protein